MNTYHHDHSIQDLFFRAQKHMETMKLHAKGYVASQWLFTWRKRLALRIIHPIHQRNAKHWETRHPQ